MKNLYKKIKKKKPMFGNNVSHSNRKTRKKFKVNKQKHKIWIKTKDKFIKLKMSTKILRTIDKVGIENL